MSVATSSGSGSSRSSVVAVASEVLDLGVDHDIDVYALVADLEADGYLVGDDPESAVIDELHLRVPTYTTTPMAS